MGIARAQTKDGTWMIVANFFPPGNFNNDEANNVFPPRDGKITSPTNKDHKPQHAGRPYTTNHAHGYLAKASLPHRLL